MTSTTTGNSTHGLENYEGVYSVKFGNENFQNDFTPLIVYGDASMEIAGVEVNATVISADYMSCHVSISACTINGWYFPEGHFTFSKNNFQEFYCNGWLLTTNDGRVGLDGNTISLFEPPTISNSIDVINALDTNDTIKFSTPFSDLGIIINANNEIVADLQKPISFNVTRTDNGFTIDNNGAYWYGDDLLYGNGTKEQALVFNLKMTQSGMIMLQNANKDDNRYVALSSDGVSLELTNETTLVIAMEFKAEVGYVGQPELLKRYGVDESLLELTPCNLDMANLCWQATGGFFLAIGLGPYMAGSTNDVKIGVMGILKTNPAVWSKVEDAWNYLLAHPQATASAIATLSNGIISAAFSTGLLWKLIKFVLTQLGWYALFRVLLHIMEWITLPELKIAQILASFMTWAAGMVVLALKISEDCGTSHMELMPMNVTGTRWQYKTNH